MMPACYFESEVYTRYDPSVWFIAEKGFLSVDSACTEWFIINTTKKI